MTPSNTIPTPRRAWYKRPTAIALLTRIFHEGYTSSAFEGFGMLGRETFYNAEGEAADALRVIYDEALQEWSDGVSRRYKLGIETPEKQTEILNDLALDASVDDVCFWAACRKSPHGIVYVDVPDVLWAIGEPLELEAA